MIIILHNLGQETLELTLTRETLFEKLLSNFDQFVFQGFESYF